MSGLEILKGWPSLVGTLNPETGPGAFGGLQKAHLGIEHVASRAGKVSGVGRVKEESGTG